MKHFTKSTILFLLLTSMILSLCGCSSSSKQVACPFTENTWESTLEEIQASEGELLESYPSTYNGTTYVYNKEYLGLSGRIKYMFDSEEK